MTDYNFLSKVSSPKIVVEAMKLLGIKEIVGKKHNPTILAWAKELGLGKIYTNDEIPWCGLLVAKVVKMAGFEPVKDPLWARNWNKFGTKQKVAMLGDVLVFERAGGGGHVAIYVGEDDTAYHVFGGNQSNATNITRIAKTRCIGIRRCPWKIAEPEAVKQVFLTSGGSLSTNEA